jgi:ferredoxin
MPSQATPPRPRPLPEISARCTGCGRCVAACGPHVLWLDTLGWKKAAVLHDAAGCTGCSRCEAVCPFDAIRMQAAPATGPERAGPSAVLAPAPA